MTDKPDDIISVYTPAAAGLITATVTPANKLTLISGERQATIDWGGDEVTYEGDLPVSEGAKIFFDHVFGYIKASREQQ